MKHLPVCCIVVLTIATMMGAKADPAGKFAFERGDDIWIANTDGTGAKKIAQGQSPDISPDGTKLVYDTVSPDMDHPKPPHLLVLDLASGKSTTLPTSDTSISDPLWSPDGKQILLTILIDSNANLGIINADGTGFHYVRTDGNEKEDYWGANWSADGQSLFAQDMENLYHLDLDGKVLKKWVIGTLIPKGEMSGASRLSPSPDGNLLLMDVQMDEDARRGWDGPPPAIYLLGLKTDKVMRLTPKKFYAWSCRWGSAPFSILYVSQKQNENDSSIYSMSTTENGKDSKLLVKKASFPSTAR